MQKFRWNRRKKERMMWKKNRKIIIMDEIESYRNENWTFR